MTKILVLYYSTYGHVETLAQAVAEGAGSIDGVEVTVKRVPELMTPEQAANAGAKTDQIGDIASPQELADYDGILFGAPTRFGNMASQMRNFMDQTGGLWAKGALVGKVGSVFTSAGGTGGLEATILSFWPTLAHHGMVTAVIPYAIEEMTDVSHVRGGSPYGAGTIAETDGSRTPIETELTIARFQGAHVAGLAKKLSA